MSTPEGSCCEGGGAGAGAPVLPGKSAPVTTGGGSSTGSDGDDDGGGAVVPLEPPGLDGEVVPEFEPPPLGLALALALPPPPLPPPQATKAATMLKSSVSSADLRSLPSVPLTFFFMLTGLLGFLN
jgi:hypothetical protein